MMKLVDDDVCCCPPSSSRVQLQLEPSGGDGVSLVFVRHFPGADDVVHEVRPPQTAAAAAKVAASSAVQHLLMIRMQWTRRDAHLEGRWKKERGSGEKREEGSGGRRGKRGIEEEGNDKRSKYLSEG